jgi:hypothetical protein
MPSLRWAAGLFAFLLASAPAKGEPLRLASLAPGDMSSALGKAQELDLDALDIAAHKTGELLEVAYEIHIGGFHLASVRLVEVVDEDRYLAVTKLTTKGLAEAIDSSDIKAVSTGAVEGRLVIPRSYNSDVTTTDNHQLVGLVFDGGKPLPVDSHPVYDLTRYPVLPELKLNTLDPLSAAVFVTMGSSANAEQRCGRTVPIFDGKRRYNLTLSYVGNDKISLGRNGYNGGKPVKALMCRAHYERVAGFKPPKPGRKPPKWPEIDVWLAPIEGTKFLVPVRMQASTEFGGVVVRAVELKVAANGNPI